MKSSSTLMVILVLQAVLVTGSLQRSPRKMVRGRQSDKTDPPGPLITPGSLQCCSKCNFSPPGLFTCDDLVNKCDRICTKCVKKGKQGLFRCADHFLGNDTIACKNHH
ncbi:hypothetical protein ACQ4PT_059090 [Festuca glaucescens]